VADEGWSDPTGVRALSNRKVTIEKQDGYTAWATPECQETCS
jgi:hypothetical protein